ncbi:MAG: hypothetical protein H6739_27450 [Alphaproteobacteria bacterium]|nr:hypothetical protein [Alphaproteobacteria bacterium]
MTERVRAMDWLSLLGTNEDHSAAEWQDRALRGGLLVDEVRGEQGVAAELAGIQAALVELQAQADEVRALTLNRDFLSVRRVPFAIAVAAILALTLVAFSSWTASFAVAGVALAGLLWVRKRQRLREERRAILRRAVELGKRRLARRIRALLREPFALRIGGVVLENTPVLTVLEARRRELARVRAQAEREAHTLRLPRTLGQADVAVDEAALSAVTSRLQQLDALKDALDEAIGEATRARDARRAAADAEGQVGAPTADVAAWLARLEAAGVTPGEHDALLRALLTDETDP